MSLELGSVLRGESDAYLVGEERGRGGFGITHRAQRQRDGLEVIVKVLKLERLEQWKSLELFEREAKVLRGLQHPGIPRYVDYFSLGDATRPNGFVLVQEYIPGHDLREVMRGERSLSPDEMRRWFVEALEILRYLQELAPAVIHRDVTPKNLLLRPDGRAALVDFGSVQAALQSTSTVSSTSAGTFGYAPMEQFVGRASPSSDLYGLAMTYLAVAASSEPTEMPLDGARVDVAQLLGPAAPFAGILHQMTDPDPRRRPRDAATVLEQLKDPARAAKGAPTSSGGLEDTTGYLTRLERRLRDEGFAILRGGRIGAGPVVFTAKRAAKGLKAAETIELVVVREEEHPGGVSGVAQAVTQANPAASRWRVLTSGPRFVVPVVIAGRGFARPPSCPATRRDVVPVAVDLAEGATHVLRTDLGPDATPLLQYLWWLVTPQADARSLARPKSGVKRIAVAAGAGTALVLAAAAVYVAVLDPATYYLVHVADPATRQIAYARFVPDGERGLDVSEVTVIDADGTVRSRRAIDPHAYPCGLSDGALTSWSCEGHNCRLERSRASSDESSELAATEFRRWWWCSVHGERTAVAHGESGQSQVWIYGRGSAAALAPGTQPGDRDPAWYPDGHRLVVSSGPDGGERLSSLDVTSGERTELGGPPARQLRPAVSPDGRRIAFYSITRKARGEARKANADEWDLSLLDPVDHSARMLIQSVCFTSGPAWLSPDELVYAKWTGEQCGLFIYDLRTEETRQIVKRF